MRRHWVLVNCPCLIRINDRWQIGRLLPCPRSSSTAHDSMREVHISALCRLRELKQLTPMLEDTGHKEILCKLYKIIWTEPDVHIGACIYHVSRWCPLQFHNVLFFLHVQFWQDFDGYCKNLSDWQACLIYYLHSFTWWRKCVYDKGKSYYSDNIFDSITQCIACNL